MSGSRKRLRARVLCVCVRACEILHSVPEGTKIKNKNKTFQLKCNHLAANYSLLINECEKGEEGG